MDDLDDLLAMLPGSEALSLKAKLRALEASRVPDPAGVWPGQPGYVPTYDPAYAALSLVGLLRAQQSVTSASSEGTAISVTGPDWASLLGYLRSASIIVQSMGSQVLTAVPIPDTPHATRVSMRGGRDDIDTDIG